VAVDGEAAETVGVAAEVLVVPVENRGMGHRHFEYFIADGLVESGRQSGDM